MNSKFWAFGGSTKPWMQNVCEGFDVTYFGRHNVDYTKPQEFIDSVTDVPDVIVFNINNAGYEPDFDKVITGDKHFVDLCDIINTTYRFELNLLEWFFGNHSNKRVLWITSMEPYNNDIKAPEEYDGDILMYRQVRALEHQAIHQQNIKPNNVSKNNIAMGTCVGHNVKGTDAKLNAIIKDDLFQPIVCIVVAQVPLSQHQLEVCTIYPYKGVNLREK